MNHCTQRRTHAWVAPLLLVWVLGSLLPCLSNVPAAQGQSSKSYQSTSWSKQHSGVKREVHKGSARHGLHGPAGPPDHGLHGPAPLGHNSAWSSSHHATLGLPLEQGASQDAGSDPHASSSVILKTLGFLHQSANHNKGEFDRSCSAQNFDH